MKILQTFDSYLFCFCKEVYYRVENSDAVPTNLSRTWNIAEQQHGIPAATKQHGPVSVLNMAAHPVHWVDRWPLEFPLRRRHHCCPASLISSRPHSLECFLSELYWFVFSVSKIWNWKRRAKLRNVKLFWIFLFKIYYSCNLLWKFISLKMKTISLSFSEFHIHKAKLKRMKHTKLQRKTAARQQQRNV